MAKATMTIQFPKSVGDAAVLLVEQMWIAINQGQMIVADEKFSGGFQEWYRCAARVLGEAEQSNQ